MLSAARVGRAVDSVGTYICADLACSLYLRGLLPLEVKYQQSTPLADRVADLRRRVSAFVGAVLEGQ